MILIKNIILILLFVLFISFNQSCTTAGFGQRADSLFLVSGSAEFVYDLKRPDQKYFLPYVLEEISGLTYSPRGTLIAVDDESGKLFEFDPIEKKIVHSIEFYKADDYEGVELVDNELFVLKNDGDLFRFTYSEDKKTKADKYENKLSGKNDTEGLGYDHELNALLIACKEYPGLDKEQISGRAFYKVNLVTMELVEDPIFTISPEKLKKFWESYKEIIYDQNRIKFKPSAIATHPISGNYYILSSVGKMLIITDKKGDIQATYPIAPRILGQPEGLCFDQNGNMYISSEGEGDRGYILKFNLQKKANQ